MKMKQCPSCFKDYDMKLYEGVCPHCGMHMNQQNESDMFREKLPLDWAKRKKQLRIVLLIALISVIALPFIGYPVMKAAIKHQIQRESPGYFESTVWTVGEEALINGASLVIQDAEWNSQTDFEIYEGHKVLRLQYAMEGAQSLKKVTEIRLRVDGEYILPIRAEGFERDLSVPEGYLGFIVPDDTEEAAFVVSEYDNGILVNRYVLEVEV